MYLDYFDELNKVLHATEVNESLGILRPQLFPLELQTACNHIAESFKIAQNTNHKLIFVGNGGSAAIASHMATDYQKNGKILAMALNDTSMLTCLANDYGYQEVFGQQLLFHGNVNDVVIVISSSGESANIINAAYTAKNRRCELITLSGFKPDNKLRSLGQTNFYVPSDQYGFVEIAHLTILHAILDIIMGWKKQ